MRGLFFGGTLVGVLIGLAIGLTVAWTVWPISYTEADPADLRLDLKDDYLRMIAATYSLDGDTARALQRLGSLQLLQPAASVAELIRRESKPLYQQALIHLALGLNQPAVALARPTYTPRPTRVWMSRRGTPTASARVTPTPMPTQQSASSGLDSLASTPEPLSIPPTSAPNPNAPRFQLEAKTPIHCQFAGEQSRIEVMVQDASGKPLPGVAIEVHWNAGGEVFYTGLKPERGMGYADTNLAPGTYNARLTENARSEVVENLKIDNLPDGCTGDSPQVRGWKLTFQQVSP